MVSVELFHYEQHKGWFEYVQKLFDRDKNWKGYFYNCKDDKWESGVREFIGKVLIKEKPDFVFVDPGVHFRPEIINYCFDKVPNIATHDTSRGEANYHWSRLKRKKDYYENKMTEGQGTIFWSKEALPLSQRTKASASHFPFNPFS